MIQREGPDTVAAFFAEPVMGAGGLIPPPEGYFEDIVPVLRRHDVLLVLDEVVSGFGRLGTYWGSQTFDLEPDLITAAKGVTSGYFPMSVCSCRRRSGRSSSPNPRRRVCSVTATPTPAHPVGAAAALATLKIIDDEKIVARRRRARPLSAKSDARRGRRSSPGR